MHINTNYGTGRTVRTLEFMMDSSLGGGPDKEVFFISGSVRDAMEHLRWVCNFLASQKINYQVTPNGRLIVIKNPVGDLGPRFRFFALEEMLKDGMSGLHPDTIFYDHTTAEKYFEQRLKAQFVGSTICS